MLRAAQCPTRGWIEHRLTDLLLESIAVDVEGNLFSTFLTNIVA